MLGNGKKPNPTQTQALAKQSISKQNLQFRVKCVSLSFDFYELTSSKERLCHLEGFFEVLESQGQIPK